MRILQPNDFLERTGDPHSHDASAVDLTDYLGAHYACACGRTHTLNGQVEPIREMNDGSARVVLACPILGQRALTLVQFRQVMAPRGVAEMGCRFERAPSVELA